MADDLGYGIPELKSPKEYHVFITHCDEDLQFAKSLLQDLTNLGYKCLFAKRDFTPGSAVVENIANAIVKSRRIVMVISKASLKSDWCNYEMFLALTNDVQVDRVSIIPLLLGNVSGSDLPYPLRYLTWIHTEEEPTCFMEKLINVIAAPDVPLKFKLPAGNVAHGLAWSYYFGYLKLVLPDIHNSIMQSNFWNGDKLKRSMCKKIIFLFPESCRCHSTLTDDDQNIKFAGHLAPVVKNRAGTVGRRYKNTVYSVFDGDKRYYFVGEYITAIHTMYEMEVSGMAGLSTPFKYRQASSFYLTVMNILNNDPKCVNKFRILFYNDSGERPAISSLLINAIQEEIQKDIDLENAFEKRRNVKENYQSIEEDCYESKQPSSVHDSHDSDISYEISNDFYNFVLFDSPEEEPVVERDETGKAKTMMNCGVTSDLLRYTNDVFITHCYEDTTFGKHILTSLESKGLKCFFQARDFTVGAAHVDNVVNAISSSKRILMVLSQASLKSEWSRYEMLVALHDDARKESKRILPVLREDVSLSDLPYEFNHLTCVNVSRDNDYMQQIIENIKAPNGTWKSQLPAGNVAHGLAWSYYFGYLRIVLPGIKERIMSSRYWKKCNELTQMCKKIVLLFPESCRCFPTLHDHDSKISVEGPLQPVVKSRAGTVNRQYFSTVYSVRDDANPKKQYFFIGEYITAILTMYEMELSNLAGLSTRDKLLQSTQFYLNIEDILKHNAECKDTYKIIYFKDQTEPDNIPNISEIILKTVKAEIEQEKFEEKENFRKQYRSDNESNTERMNTSYGGGIVNGDSSRKEMNNFQIDTSMMYEFMLFDKPEIVKDKSGNPKTIEKGDECMNLLIPSGRFLDNQSP